jgi:hypothetical protein
MKNAQYYHIKGNRLKLQNPNQINVDNSNNVRLKASRTYRDKMRISKRKN